MSTILFHQIVYGPIHSRRLGVSLGVNLLPTDGKICTFDCVYCECGWNREHRPAGKMPTREEVREALTSKLEELRETGVTPDVMTFAGNGEPTLHPDFEGIIDDTLAARDRLFPSAKVAVLSTATTLDREGVFRALKRVDDNILKLDSVLDSRIRQMNKPNKPVFCFSTLVDNLCRFEGNLMIQTMFLRGELEDIPVDNTSEEEIAGWLRALERIRPKSVMIYTIDRETPAKNLRKVPVDELERIANRARALGFTVSVAG